MLRLRVKAPFGAFRAFSAGAYRPSAPFITPSAAYGLLLHVAGIESRLDDGGSAMTVMQFGLPRAEIALGAVRLPTVQTIYQQLHNYPVGAVKPEVAERTRGNKPNIQPIRREYLSGVDGYVCLRGNEDLEARVREGLRLGTAYRPEGAARYGVPFLGDNSFLLSVLREEGEEPTEPAHWFVLARREDGARVPNPCRLTVWIDRASSARTVVRLYGRQEERQVEPPDGAWTEIRPLA